jgi:hypothetical protein
MYINTYIHIHTYIPTYLHTYIPTYIPTYIHACIQTHTHTRAVVAMQSDGLVTIQDQRASGMRGIFGIEGVVKEVGRLHAHHAAL